MLPFQGDILQAFSTALLPAKDNLINTSLWEAFLLDQHSALSAAL